VRHQPTARGSMGWRGGRNRTSPGVLVAVVIVFGPLYHASAS
jgi:hypothetical protein